MKQCNECHEIKPLEEFQKRASSKDGHAGKCKPCKRAYDNAHYAANPERRDYIRENRVAARQVSSQFFYDYFTSHPCAECGETDPVVLQFDHLDPKTKKYAVANMRGNSMETILAEIAKCRVLCANCHMRHTAVQLGWYANVVR